MGIFVLIIGLLLTNSQRKFELLKMTIMVILRPVNMKCALVLIPRTRLKRFSTF